ncbi:hypothetical protein FGB62_21g432 [Gracilaria domingensis]|nr:hypothetical protein FGB62_21g432 [Gracilaria domingensis]
MNFLSIVFFILHLFVDYLPSFLSSRLQAALFILTLVAPDAAPSKIRSVSYWVADCNTRIYSSRPLRPSSRTIVVIHGNAPSGSSDPRVIVLARAIASANPNNVVIVPHITSLAQMKLEYEPIVRIMRSIVRDKSLCKSGTLSFVGPCIPIGLSLIASTIVNASDSFLCVGAHADFHSSKHHMVTRCDQEDSRYALNAMFANFWHPPNEKLEAMFRAYCDDDHYRNVGKKSNILERLMEENKEEAKTFNRLRDDIGFLKEKMDVCHQYHKDTLTRLSPIEYVDRLSCKSVVLIHAQTDDVIPPEQNAVLKQAIDKVGKVSTSAKVTRLLNHGDQQPLSVADIPEVLSLINVLSLFFSTKSYSS